MKKLLLKYGLAVLAGGHSCLVHSTDFSALTVGQLLADNAIRVGQFELRLPEGRWTVLSKLVAQSGFQGGGSAVPTLLTVAIAQTESLRLNGILIVRTPASSFLQVNQWSDDPCGGVKGVLVKDTMNQSIRMPECFTVSKYAPTNITSETTGVLSDIAKWLKDTKVDLPENLLRVYYAKYNGGDFMHTYVYLPGTPDNFSGAETWGRGLAQEVSKMVTRGSSSAVLPALPR